MGSRQIYILHPEEFPIQLNELESPPLSNSDSSHLKLICHSANHYSDGSSVTIKIPQVQPDIEVQGTVAWCHDADNGYELGIRFTSKDAIMRIRMLEQLCYIHRYRKAVLMDEGRSLTDHDAALEWIAKYAALFPVDNV